MVLHATVSAAAFEEKLSDFDFLLLGLTVSPDPPEQVVPRNTATGLHVRLAFSDVNADAEGLLSLLPSGLEVAAELVGPGIADPISLRGPPGALLPIPPLVGKGVYLVRDIRLEKDGATFLRASPDSATVEVIERVLITEVRTRPLTLEEIRQKGILFGDDSFSGFNFTLALRLDSRPVTIDFPVVFDSNDIPIPISASGGLDISGDGLPLVNTGLVPVMMRPQIPAGQEAEVLALLPDVRIPGLIVVPGDVGFLNQFFSALLLVSNGAPAGSTLAVRDLEASIELPPGEDGVGSTFDDPLVVAETETGGVALLRPILGLGADGEPGTNDDTRRFDPGQQGQAEFLLEGRREGFHAIRFDIEGMLDGLPIGPVPVTGVARGGVLVRNPTFNLTFTAPATVRAGEAFSLFVTVTNVSSAAANLVTVRLDEAQISGATLLTGPTGPIPTLLENDSEVLEFRFVSQTTGQVSASYLNVEEGTGDLLFTLGVGERGVPLSPDTLVLPKSVESLPPGVVTATLRVLGQGWSVATAPNGALRDGVVRVSRQTVLDRASELAEAGFRIQLGEPLEMALESIGFSWASSADVGFEQILRATSAGKDFFAALGEALAPSGSVVDFQRGLATELSGLGAHAAVSVGDGAGEAPLDWSVADAAGRTLDPDGFGDLRNAAFLPLSTAGTPGRGTALLTRLGSSLYTWNFASTAVSPASFDLAVSLPRSDGTTGLHAFTGVATGPGESGRLTLDLLASAPVLTLEIDRDGDGVFEDSVVETSQEVVAAPPPTLLAATAIGPETLTGADPFGRVVALLFDRPMREREALATSNFTVEENVVRSSSLQLSSRLVFLFVEAPVSDFVERTLQAGGLFDATGQPLPTVTTPIASRLTDEGAIVSGRVLNADGSPVPGAEVLYINSVPGNVSGISKKIVDALGRYQFDWVRKSPDGPFSMRALDPATGSVQQLSTRVGFDGESLVVDLVLLGRGGVTGVVRDSGGSPLAKARVLVTSEVDPSSFALVETNGEGRYTATGIVVGPLTVKAVFETSSGLAFGNLQRAGTFTSVDVNVNLTVGSVSGTVVELASDVQTPVPDIDVFYLVPDPASSREFVAAKTTTNPSGAYAFSDVPVPAGSFRIVAIDRVRSRQASAQGSFGPGQSLVTGLDVFFVADTFGAVEVTVHGADGLPVGAGEAVVTVTGRQLLTDASGKATFGDLPPGTYGVSARGAGSSRSVNASAMVVETQTASVNLQLPGTGRLVVTLLDASGAVLPSHPVVRTFSDPCAGEQVVTGTDGIAVFEDVPIGNVTVKSLRGADLAVASTFLQRAGDERALVLRFSGFGTVTGTISDANGPFLGASVVLASGRIEPTFCIFVEDGAAQQVRTGIDGTYRFTNVPLGAFTVSASEPTFYPVPVSASDVLRTPGETKTVDLELASTNAGELSGTVLLPDGTTPAGAGVRVTVSGGGRPNVTVTTGTDGGYAFAAIFPQGRYTLTAADPATGKLARESIYLLDDQDMTKNLRLLGRSPVEVTVLRGDGTPAAEAFVELSGAAYPFDVAAGNVTPFDAGTVVFPRISEGRFTVTANDGLGRGGRASGTVTEDGVLTRVTVNLTVTGSVTGTFLTADGTEPIPNAEVVLRQGSTGRLLGSTTTSPTPGEMGTFRFDFVPAGTVLATATDPLTGRIGEGSGTLESEGETVDLSILALGLGKVSGTVTSGGSGVAAANVELTSSTGLSSSVANLRVTSTTGAGGVFVFDGVPVGSFTVKATLPGASPLTGSVSGNLTEDGEEITDLEVPLAPSGSVLGSVLRADAATEVPGASLTLRPAQGVLRGQSNASGAYRFDFVPAGAFSLTAEEAGGRDAGLVSGTLAESEELVVDVVFNGTGTISGTALDSDGTPLPSGRVRLTRPAPFPRDETTTVGSDGLFRFFGVPVGALNLSLSVDGSPLRGSKSATLVTDGDDLPVTIQLAPATSVIGTLEKPDGIGGTVPAANVSVTLTGGGVYLTTLSGANGAFTLSGVPEGTFSVKAEDALTGGLASASATVSLPDPPPFDPVDLGTLVLDLEPIEVAAIAPVPGATLVPPDASVVLTFTDPVEPGSVPGRIAVSSGGASVAGTTTVSPDGFAVTFDPIPFLPPSSPIDVLVNAALKDTFGRSLGADFASSFSTGGTVVTGRVTNAGAPVTGAQVELTASSGSGTATTGGDGRFRFENVGLGPATVVATSAGLTGSRVVELGPTDGVVDVSDIPLQFVATLAGQVFAFDGSPGPSGLEVRVTQGTTLVGFSTTAAGGLYQVDNVPLGAFTLDVLQVANGDRARRTGTLDSGGLAGFDVTLNGIGDVRVGVVDGDGVALDGVEVSLSYTLFGTPNLRNGTTAGGEVLFTDVAAGSISVSAVDPVTTITASSTATAVAGTETRVDLALEAPGAIAGTLFEPGGTVPFAGGATVRVFRESGNVLRGEAAAAGDGTYGVSDLPPSESPYRVDALVGGQARARARGVVVPPGGVATVDLELVGVGTVAGTVLPPAGETLSPFVVVTLTSLAPDVGGIFTDAQAGDGGYELSNVPHGPFRVTARDNVNGFFGEAEGELDAATLTVDLQLVDNAVSFGNGIQKRDGNEFVYVIRPDGALKNGKNLLFDATTQGAPRLRVDVDGSGETDFTGGPTGFEEDGGREIATVVETFGAVDVQRKIAVPLGGYFARYLEIFENPTGSPASVVATLESNVNNRFDGPPTVVLESSGDGFADPSDLWVVTDDGADTDPFENGDIAPVGFVLADGVAPLRPDDVTFANVGTQDGQLLVRYAFDVPAGGRVALLHFVALELSRDAAGLAVERLAALPPEALAGLSASEILDVQNFDVPAGGSSTVEPLPALDGTVTGSILAVDGTTPVSTSTGAPGLKAFFQSNHPLYRRLRPDTSVTTGYGFTADLGAGLAIPRVGFTATAAQTYGTHTVTAATTGDFPPGVTAVARDIVFSDSLSVAIAVTDATGSPTAATLSLKVGTANTALRPTAADGTFFFAPIPLDTNVNVAARSSVGHNFQRVEANVSSVVPDTLSLPLTLPAGASVSGVITRGGATVASQPVFLIADTGPGAGQPSASDFTDASGVYQFVEVPSGDYRLSVSSGGITTVVPITVSAPTPVSQNIQIPVLATVNVQVLHETAGAPDPASSARVDLTTSLGALKIATTNASGQVSITNVPEGPFTLSVRHPSNFSSFTGASGVVGAGGQPVSVEVVIPAFGTVSGTVLFGDGATAASGTSVTLSGPDVVTESKTTNASGGFTFTNVRALRTFTVTAAHPTPNRSHVTGETTGQLSADGASLTGVDVVLPATGTVEVTVTDESTGNGLSGVDVSIQDAFSATFRSEGTTDASGFRSIGIVPLGGFTVRAELSGQLVGEGTGTIAVHEEVVSVAIVRPSDATVEGTVFAGDGLTPVASAPVELRSEDGATLLDAATADADGAYRFEGALAPGTTALVRAELPGDPAVFVEATVTATEAGEILVQDLVLDAAVVKGFVFEADGSTPVEGAWVDLRAEASLDVVSETTASDGSYAFVNVPEGVYELLAEDGFGLVGYASGELLPGSLELAVDVLLPEHGTVEGFVTDSGGGPLSASPVVLVNANVLSPLSVFPDASGFFRFERVALGSFSVTYDHVPAGVVVPAGAVGRIDLPGETVQANLVVPGTGTVEGEVQDASGVVLGPNEDTFVEVEGRERETASGIYRSSPPVEFDTVSFIASGVPEGEVTVVADNVDGAGMATGTVVDGATTTVNVQLGTAVLLPATPEPPFTVERDGTLTGSLDAVSESQTAYFISTTNAKAFPELAATAPGEVTLGPVRLAGLSHTRRVLVPTGAPYARVLDVLENPNAVAVEVTLELVSDLFSGGAPAFSTGYASATTADGSGVAVVYGGPSSSLSPDLLGADGIGVVEEWRDLVVPAGGRVILLHFAVEAVDEATAQSQATALANVSGASSELSDLSASERADIVNFELP